MTREKLKNRTKVYSTRIVKLCQTLPNDWVAKCDESLFWMELLIENNLVKSERLQDLMREGGEILAIVVSSAKTARLK